MFQLDIIGVQKILNQSQPFIATVETRYGDDSIILTFDGVDLGSMIQHKYHFDSFKDERMFLNGKTLLVRRVMKKTSTVFETFLSF